jgi:hypothetical protein
MKKIFLGLSSALFVMTSAMGMKSHDGSSHSDSPLVSDVTIEKVQLQSRSNPTKSESVVVLPESKSGKLIFKKMHEPACIAESKSVSEVEVIKQRLRAIQNVAIKNSQELLPLSRQLISDEEERESLSSVIGIEGIISLDDLCISINERLLELGVLDPFIIASSMFCSSDAAVVKRCAERITYDGRAISEHLLYVAGLYICAIAWNEKGWIGTMDASPIMSRVLSRVRPLELPKDHYISWGIEKAFSDPETQKMVVFQRK